MKFKEMTNGMTTKPEGVIENERAKILWDFMIQCDNTIEHRET